MKIRDAALLMALLYHLLTCLSGCSKSDDQSLERSTIEAIAEASLPEPVCVLGSSEKDAVISIGVDFASTANDTVFVLDGPAREVLAFDLQGEVLYSFGRAGSGPGEFDTADTMTLWNDHLIIGDSSLHRISLFTLTGEYLSSFSVPGPPTSLAAADGFLFIGIRSADVIAIRINLSHPADVVEILTYDNPDLAQVEGFGRLTSPKLVRLGANLYIALPNIGRIFVMGIDGKMKDSYIIENDLTATYKRYHEDRQSKATNTFFTPHYIVGLAGLHDRYLLIQMNVPPDGDHPATIVILDPGTGQETGPRLIATSKRFLYLRSLANGLIAWSALDEGVVNLYRFDSLLADEIERH